MIEVISSIISSIILIIGFISLALAFGGALFMGYSHWSDFCIEWTHNVKNYKHWSLISDVMLISPILLLSLLFIGLGSIYFLIKGEHNEQTNYQQDRGPAVEACRQLGGAGTHCTCACHGDSDAEVRRNP